MQKKDSARSAWTRLCTWHSKCSPLWRGVLPVVWMALIFYFSAQPDLPGAPNPFWDTVIKKMGHMAGYAVLLLLLWQALGSSELRLAWVLTVIYAVTDEFHQTLVPGRYGTHWDVLIDATGALMGTLVGWTARRWFR